MSVQYMMPEEHINFDELLNVDTSALFDPSSFEAILGSSLSNMPITEDMLNSVQLQDMLNFAGALDMGVHNTMSPVGEYLSDASYFSGPDSPMSESSSETNPFASLVIPSDAHTATQISERVFVKHPIQLPNQVTPFALFPAMSMFPLQPITAASTAQQTSKTTTAGVATAPKKSPSPVPSVPSTKRAIRAPTVSWQAGGPTIAATPTSAMPIPVPAKVSISAHRVPSMTSTMPSPPLSPPLSIKSEPSTASSTAMVGLISMSERTSSGGIKTPFDDMADEDLDELDEDEIQGMMGKVGHAGVKKVTGAAGEKKKRKRRTTAELAPQELEVRRIKNSEAARRCRLRKTLKLRWLEARCAELEEVNGRLVGRLADLESRMSA